MYFFLGVLDPSQTQSSMSITPTISQIFKQNVIFVSGLPLDISEEQLFDKLSRVFSIVGNIKINQQANKSSIHLFKDKVNRTRLTGSAKITFEREESVMKAIEKYNGKCVPILNDNQIYVKKPEVATAGPSETLRPNPTELKVWVKIEERLVKREEYTSTMGIEDLKEVVFKGQNDRDLYEVYYRNQRLGPGGQVPSDTTSGQPIVFKKIAEPPPTASGGPPLFLPKPITPSFISTDYHIIVDNSNIFIGSQTIRDPKTGLNQKNSAIRVNVKNLVRVLEDGKLKICIKSRIVGGSVDESIPRDNAQVWTDWESCGYKCILGVRSKNGPEVFVDDMLHAQILTILHSYNNTQRSQVLVLVTGDGNRNKNQTSFSDTVERVLTSDWSVELWSWKQSLNSCYFNIQKFFPSRMTIKYLDSYRNNITFIQ
ncbi:unnamed protein product [Rotaria socialis]|uniref:RRM domain-containing protein n=1 Tax=Rotaria socialis TaxID=392032 RepID=A0A818EE09_9BILA|nr:unnamed protein product [Rotaria socialis]